MSDREAMKLALEALEFNQARWQGKDEALEALRTALAAPRLEVTVDPRLTPDEAAAISSALAAPRPEPEPVAYFDLQKQVFFWAKPTMIDVPMTVALNPLPLYAAPPAAAPRPEPSGYAYRYADGVLRLNDGSQFNGGWPVEAVPYWFAPPDNEALRRDAERLKANRDNLLWIVKELAANKSENEAEIERLREALRGIAKIDFRNVDSIWARLLLREVVDKTKDALRREET